MYLKKAIKQWGLYVFQFCSLATFLEFFVKKRENILGSSVLAQRLLIKKQ